MTFDEHGARSGSGPTWGEMLASQHSLSEDADRVFGASSVEWEDVPQPLRSFPLERGLAAGQPVLDAGSAAAMEEARERADQAERQRAGRDERRDRIIDRYALTPAEVESLTESARAVGGFVPPDLRGMTPTEALDAIMEAAPVVRADALTEEEILSTAPSWRPGGLVDKALAAEADYREGLSAEASRRVREARRAAGRSLVETAAPSSPVKVPVRYLGGFGTEDEFTLTRTVTLDWPTGMVFDEVPMLAELVRVALFRTSESEPWAVQSVFVKGRALDGEGRESGAWGGYQAVIERWRWADGAGPDWLRALVESVTPGV